MKQLFMVTGVIEPGGPDPRMQSGIMLEPAVIDATGNPEVLPAGIAVTIWLPAGGLNLQPMVGKVATVELVPMEITAAGELREVAEAEI